MGLLAVEMLWPLCSAQGRWAGGGGLTGEPVRNAEPQARPRTVCTGVCMLVQCLDVLGAGSLETTEPGQHIQGGHPPPPLLRGRHYSLRWPGHCSPSSLDPA